MAGRHRFLVIFAIVLFVSFQSGFALQCYECSSENSDTCAEKPEEKELKECEADPPIVSTTTESTSTTAESTSTTAESTSTTADSTSTTVDSTSTTADSTSTTAESTSTTAESTSTTAESTSTTADSTSTTADSTSTTTESTTTTSDEESSPTDSSSPSSPNVDEASPTDSTDTSSSDPTQTSSAVPAETSKNPPSKPGNSGTGGNNKEGEKKKDDQTSKDAVTGDKNKTNTRQARSVLLGRFARTLRPMDDKPTYICFKEVVTKDGKDIVKRGCSNVKDYCKEDDKDKKKKECDTCTKDGCNLASSTAAYASLLLSLAAAVVFYAK